MRKQHVCGESRTCTCYILGTEPDEDCPMHGHPFPPRCGECGKFMKWPKYELTEEECDEFIEVNK